MDANHRSTSGISNLIKWPILIFFWANLLGFLLFMGKMLWIISRQNITEIANNQLITVFLALCFALFIVMFLPITTGPIDFGYGRFRLAAPPAQSHFGS